MRSALLSLSSSHEPSTEFRLNFRAMSGPQPIVSNRVVKPWPRLVPNIAGSSVLMVMLRPASTRRRMRAIVDHAGPGIGREIEPVAPRLRQDEVRRQHVVAVIDAVAFQHVAAD